MALLWKQSWPFLKYLATSGMLISFLEAEIWPIITAYPHHVILRCQKALKVTYTWLSSSICGIGATTLIMVMLVFFMLEIMHHWLFSIIFKIRQILGCYQPWLSELPLLYLCFKYRLWCKRIENNDSEGFMSISCKYDNFFAFWH